MLYTIICGFIRYDRYYLVLIEEDEMTEEPIHLQNTILDYYSGYICKKNCTREAFERMIIPPYRYLEFAKHYKFSELPKIDKDDDAFYFGWKNLDKWLGFNIAGCSGKCI